VGTSPPSLAGPSPLAAAMAPAPVRMPGPISGNATLSPEEQVAMMQNRIKATAVPSDIGESNARAAANLAQAQMLTTQANKLGAQMPMPVRLPSGQIVSLTGPELAQHLVSQQNADATTASVAVHSRAVAVEEQLKQAHQDLINAQASHATESANEAAARVTTLTNQAASYKLLQGDLAAGKIKLSGVAAEDTLTLLKYDPKIAEQYLHGLAVGSDQRKAMSMVDFYNHRRTEIAKRLDGLAEVGGTVDGTPKGKRVRDLTQEERAALEHSLAIADTTKFYDTKTGTRLTTPSSGARSSEYSPPAPGDASFDSLMYKYTHPPSR
jgi:hypothetical protein